MRKIRASEYKNGMEEGIAQGIEQGLKLGIEQGIIEICKEMNLTFEQTAEKPVSYTHLDVYKRQIRNRKLAFPLLQFITNR